LFDLKSIALNVVKWIAIVLLALFLGYQGWRLVVTYYNPFTFVQEIQNALANNHQTEVAYEKLKGELSQAQTVNTTNKKLLTEKINQISLLVKDKEALKAQLDKMNAEGQIISEAETGQGSVTLEAWLESKMPFKFHDGWQDIDVIGPNKLHYKWHFDIHDISIQTKDENNNVTTIYTVYLQNRDGAKLYLDYKKSFVDQKPEYHLLNWWDPKIRMTNFAGIKGVEFGGALSLCSVSLSQKQKDYLLVFPEISMSSNFREGMDIGIGGGINIAHWLPLFENLWVDGRLVLTDYDKTSVIGIGVTL